MAHNGLSECLSWFSNLVPPLPTQNMPSGLICVAKRLFLVYFGPFLAQVGPHLGHYWSGKWAKLINLDVLSARSIKYGVPYGHNPENTIFCPFLGLFGSF